MRCWPPAWPSASCSALENMLSCTLSAAGFLLGTMVRFVPFPAAMCPALCRVWACPALAGAQTVIAGAVRVVIICCTILLSTQLPGAQLCSHQQVVLQQQSAALPCRFSCRRICWQKAASVPLIISESLAALHADTSLHLLQGDILVAESLEQALKGPGGQQRLLASFIHWVVPPRMTVSSLESKRSNNAACLAAWRDRRIYLHKTHVGMAVQVRNCVNRECSST